MCVEGEVGVLSVSMRDGSAEKLLVEDDKRGVFEGAEDEVVHVVMGTTRSNKVSSKILVAAGNMTVAEERMVAIRLLGTEE